MMTMFILFIATMALAAFALFYVGVSAAVLIGKLLVDVVWLTATVIMGLGKLAVVVAVAAVLLLLHLFSGLFVALGVMLLAVVAACGLVSMFSRCRAGDCPDVVEDAGDIEVAMSPAEQRVHDLVGKFNAFERRLKRLDARLGREGE